MPNDKSPSILDQFSRFNLYAFAAILILMMGLTMYWGIMLVTQKKADWESGVKQHFNVQINDQLGDIVRQVETAAASPVIAASASSESQAKSDLILSKLISLLSINTSKVEALDYLGVFYPSGKKIAESKISNFNLGNLQKISGPIVFEKTNILFEGIYVDKLRNQVFLRYKRNVKADFSDKPFFIEGYVNVNDAINIAADDYGDGFYFLTKNKEVFEKSFADGIPDFQIQDSEPPVSSTNVTHYSGELWLPFALDSKHMLFIHLRDPHIGIGVFLWQLLASIAILAVLSWAFIKGRLKLKRKFEFAVESLAGSSIEDLTNPDTFSFKEGKLVSSFYKPHFEALKLQVNELEQLAYRDPLTGYLNSRSFIIEVNELTGRNDSEFMILSIDINHFDRIATAHGPSIANQIFVLISEKISDFLTLQKIERFSGNDSGFILGLLGPARIGVVFNAKDKNIDEEYLAHNIINMTKRTMRVANNEVFVTANVGTSSYPYDAQNCNDLIQRANIALEKSKNVGEAQFCVYSGEFQGDLVRVETLQSDMSRAQKQREFRLYYQPIFNDRNMTVGVEALIRWNHPTFGLISPNEFISIAEGNGFIVDIGYWILIHACKQCAQWNKNGLRPIRMSINVSCKQLLDRDFAKKVFHAIDGSELNPSQLSLEITETTAMNVDETIQRNINSIKERGIKISMDDFGTGHSSLARLIDMRVDTIKIDRAFVQDIESNETKLKIVKSITEMSKALDLDVICEGVENITQLKLLKELGLKKFQGFVFSKPVSALKIEESIRNEADNVIAIDMRKH